MSSIDLNAHIKPLMVAEDWPAYQEKVKQENPFYGANPKGSVMVRLKGTDMGVKVSIVLEQQYQEAKEEAIEFAKLVLMSEGAKALLFFISQGGYKEPIITEIEV